MLLDRFYFSLCGVKMLEDKKLFGEGGGLTYVLPSSKANEVNRDDTPLLM